jgi:8-oxo-dGTP pyrophosphatase MutT (NUDIX family)
MGVKREIATIVLWLPSKKLVVQRRDAHAPTSANMIGFFGGSIEQGESPEAAMLREISEETNLQLTSDNISKMATIDSDEVLVHIFQAQITEPPSEVYEGVGYELHDLEELHSRTDIAHIAQLTLQELRKDTPWHLA